MEGKQPNETPKKSRLFTIEEKKESETEFETYHLGITIHHPNYCNLNTNLRITIGYMETFIWFKNRGKTSRQAIWNFSI